MIMCKWKIHELFYLSQSNGEGCGEGTIDEQKADSGTEPTPLLAYGASTTTLAPKQREIEKSVEPSLTYYLFYILLLIK